MKTFDVCQICKSPANGKMFHYACVEKVPDVFRRQAWLWCENVGDPARLEEFVKVGIARSDAQARKAADVKSGDLVPTTVWYDGRVYTGNAVRVDGRWTFSGTQNRQFTGRRAYEINITDWRSFDPRYKGRQEVMEGKDKFTVSFPR